MTLSLHERRVLIDIERQLAYDDPRLVRRLRAFTFEEPVQAAPEPEARPPRPTTAQVATLEAFILVIALIARNVAVLALGGAVCLAAVTWTVVRRWRLRHRTGTQERLQGRAGDRMP